MTKLIIFDLDGTLAETKSSISLDMADQLEQLLKCYQVAIISGGMFSQFKTQLIDNLPIIDKYLTRLHLFPTNATSYYIFENNWKQVYQISLSKEDKEKIISSLKEVLKEVGFVIPKQLLYGEIIEDRDSQITFSALGQQAPNDLKKKWDPNHLKRLEIINLLSLKIPGFEIRSGGSTSIDITQQGINKAYGIEQMEKYLGVGKEDMLFIGDAIFPGGNDYAVKTTGVKCIETSGPMETLRIIKKLCQEFDSPK